MRVEPTAAVSPRSVRLVGPALTLKEINVVCWGLFLAFLVVPAGVLIGLRVQEGALLKGAEVDFTYFYGLGRILNEYPPERLYDYDLQQRIFTEVHPLNTGRYGPSPYPPMVATFFRPFARLPFTTAYLIWVAISLSFYIVGLAIVTGHYFPRDALRRSLIFCLALSFYPFTWTIASGQLSTVGFLALALAFREEERGSPLVSGLALSLCAYKPVLLVFLIPMLVVTRRYRTLFGFSIGALAVVLLVTAIEGVRIWSGYLNLLLSFGRGAAHVDSGSFKQVGKFVDLAAFSSAIAGRHPAVGTVLFLGTTCAVAVALFRAWRKSGLSGKPPGTLVWAATLTWTLVVNVYVPIYDCVFAVPGIIATAAILKNRWFTALWLLIFAAPWVSVRVAQATGFQMLTILLAGLGILQLAALRNSAEASL